MGCLQSVYDRYPALGQHKQFLSHLLMGESEIVRMYNIFRSFDTDDSGSIDIVEFLTFIDVERTHFTDRAFHVLKGSKGQSMDLKEFIQAIWDYGALSSNCLIDFAFDLYDLNGSNKLNASEILQMLIDLYGKDHVADNVRAQTLIKSLDHLDGQRCDRATFKKLSGNHQVLLFPAFQLQLKFRKKVFGIPYWDNLESLKLKITNGKSVRAKEFAKMHYDYVYGTVDATDEMKAKSRDSIISRVSASFVSTKKKEVVVKRDNAMKRATKLLNKYMKKGENEDKASHGGKASHEGKSPKDSKPDKPQKDSIIRRVTKVLMKPKVSPKYK